MPAANDDRPRLVRGALALLLVMPLGAEYLIRNPPQTRLGARLVQPLLEHYVAARAWFFDRWLWLVPLLVVGLALSALAFRFSYQWWHNTVLAKLTGTDFSSAVRAFPKLDFELRPYLAGRPPGTYFIGLDQRGKPVYLPEPVLNTHMHIVGPTGTGKTESVLFPLMLQDMMARKGVIFIDAKGSYSNIMRFKALAAIAGRADDVRIFSLAYPEVSSSYNPIYMSDRSDPLTTAERVFSDFEMDEPYYRGQAKLFFYSLVRLMAGTGKPFNLRDIRLAVGDAEALDHVMEMSRDQKAKYDISQQLAQLGDKRHATFTGLYNCLADYDPGGPVSDLLNSYNPDIVVDEVLNRRQLVYFHLPANMYQLLAPSIGKIVLRHLASAGSARDTHPDQFDQTPFAVCIDECHQFVFESLIMSLAMLRSAKVQFRLAHQTLADLTKISPSFERAVRTNTRCKILLFSDDPDHLELVARSYGTETTFKKTIRYTPGPLFTHINTGEASNREVQEFKVHPDALKSLAECGQGFLLLPRRVEQVSFAVLPPFEVPDYPLTRRPTAEGLDLFRYFVAPKLAILIG